MTSDNDKKAAEEYGNKYGSRPIIDYEDYELVEAFESSEEPSRYSCDGCEQNKKALKYAFLAGCEHKQKELEQIKEQVAREAYYEAYERNENGWFNQIKAELDFNYYYQQKNKGEG